MTNLIIDKYFSKTKEIIQQHGDKTVVYAVFIRKPALYACGYALNWLRSTAQKLNFPIKIIENFTEGDKTGAGAPLFYVEGSFLNLVELETELLQKVGLSCICAYNAHIMSMSLKNTNFIAMEARHCGSKEIVEQAEYGASIGSRVAQKSGAKGFIGSSIDEFSNFFGATEGFGTMPHALIGYTGSTLLAAQFYFQTFNNQKLTVLVDYFGREITDSLEVCNYFKNLVDLTTLSLRIDTHGGRYLEGLNKDLSYLIIEKYAPNAFYEQKDHEELNYLIGTGVSAAAIWYLREQLDEAGFQKVNIVASSGFTPKKCNVMSHANAPVNVIGTGSFIPEKWTDTYSTADIISYDGIISVKKGREFLINRWLNK